MDEEIDDQLANYTETIKELAEDYGPKRKDFDDVEAYVEARIIWNLQKRGRRDEDERS